MYADTVSELLSAVIPGYDELPSNENGDEAAFVARYEAAIELANLVQAGLVIDATENDGWSGVRVSSPLTVSVCRRRDHHDAGPCACPGQSPGGLSVGV